MTEPADVDGIAARIAALGALPLEERADGYGELLAELQARLESADAAG